MEDQHRGQLGSLASRELRETLSQPEQVKGKIRLAGQHLALAVETIEHLDPNEEWVWELRTHLANAWRVIKSVGGN